MHRRPHFLIFLLASLLLCPAAWAKPGILDVRLGQHPGSTRIVVELSETTAYRVGLMAGPPRLYIRSEEHTSELQSHVNLVCRLLLEKKKKKEEKIHQKINKK